MRRARRKINTWLTPLSLRRFSTAAAKGAPKPSSHPDKPKAKTAENPKLLKKKLKASMGAGGNALEGLTFVITGATEDRPREEVRVVQEVVFSRR